ncbi:MAG: hypothetical protein ACKV2T_37730 [Kofleriaceae bacterium]
MRISLLAAIATVGLMGCIGSVEQGGNPLETGDGDGNDNGDNPAGSDLSAAKQLFDTNVFPVINAKCTGSACHAETSQGATLTRFVATDPMKGWQTATNYQALVGNFTATAAPILTKIKPGTHYNVSYTTDDEAKITAWLTKELELRNGQTVPTTPGQETLAQASERVLAEFAGCMTLLEFQTADMAQAWGDMDAQNNQQCENCHATGGEGFIASRNETFMWNVFSNRKYFFLQYLTVDLLAGPAAAKVIINETSFRGVATAMAPHQEHPTFNAGPNSQGMVALKQFYDQVMAKKTAGTCGTPRPFPM